MYNVMPTDLIDDPFQFKEVRVDMLMYYEGGACNFYLRRVVSSYSCDS